MAQINQASDIGGALGTKASALCDDQWVGAGSLVENATQRFRKCHASSTRVKRVKLLASNQVRSRKPSGLAWLKPSQTLT